MTNGFFVRCKCKFRRFTGCKSRNLHAADGGKDIARRAAELCGGALIFFQKPLANNFKDWYTFYDAHADFVRFRFTSADMVFCAYCHF